MSYENVPVITKELLLANPGPVAIYKKYMKVEVQEDYHFCNPLRVDEQPTCTFKWINGKLWFRDWRESKSKDCFDIVQFIYDCKFQEALDIIAKDFNLVDGEYTHRPQRPVYVRTSKPPVNLQVKRQPLTKYCIEYMASQGISLETLIKYNVVGIRAVWVRGRKVYDWKPSDLCFGYDFAPDRMPPKLYFPMRKKGDGRPRFFNPEQTVLEGYAQLPETGDFCLVTKSYKDDMCMHEFSIPACNPSSEGVLISPIAVEIIRPRFKGNLFSLMDNDRTGKHMAWMLRKEYGIEPLLFEKGEPKDFTDNYKHYGRDYMVDLIEYTKQYYNIHESSEENYNTQNIA